MKIYVTKDCIGKLTPFEEMLLLIIKGECQTNRQIWDGDANIKVADKFNTVVIRVAPFQKGNRIEFKIENTSAGLAKDIKKLVAPFMFGFEMSTHFDEENYINYIISERFETEKKTVTYNTGKEYKKL